MFAFAANFVICTQPRDQQLLKDASAYDV